MSGSSARWRRPKDTDRQQSPDTAGRDGRQQRATEGRCGPATESDDDERRDDAPERCEDAHDHPEGGRDVVAHDNRPPWSLRNIRQLLMSDIDRAKALAHLVEVGKAVDIGAVETGQ
jgi:hypothetical protein